MIIGVNPATIPRTADETIDNANILIESYCPDDVDFTLNPFMYQKAHICTNDCSTGVCIKEVEITPPVKVGFIQRIINWFRRLFS